jgi:hypothetical protein
MEMQYGLTDRKLPILFSFVYLARRSVIWPDVRSEAEIVLHVKKEPEWEEYGIDEAETAAEI